MLSSIKQDFENYLQMTTARLYPSQDPLHQACAYALQGEGKRIRPLLTILCADLPGALGKLEDAFAPAMALEMVHTYSLVHDDLPCIDNDDLRRGRPTVHRKFSESTAVLVGDALLTDAFYLLSSEAHGRSAEIRLHLMISRLSRAAGGSGMVLGQAMDIRNIGAQELGWQQVAEIHALKTAELFAASCYVGACWGGADPRKLDQYNELGFRLGQLFQIQDDLLDHSPLLGKSSGKDAAQEKVTAASALGRERATQLCLEYKAAIENILGALDQDLGNASQQIAHTSADHSTSLANHAVPTKCLRDLIAKLVRRET